MPPSPAAQLQLRPARPDEASLLTQLALLSKATWGYDAAFLERCRPELTLLPAQLAPLRAHVATTGDTLLGFFTVAGAPPAGALEHLYVAPEAMARGVGRALLEGAAGVARNSGFRSLQIAADPNAERFYLSHGARRIGEVPSGSIPGRLLPLLVLDL